jgi:N-carbamoyl-L-amino-acid hydrolase
MPLDPKRTVAELKELRALTADENGAQRVAWGPVWRKARAFLGEKLAGLPVTTEVDEAGNFWATLPGRDPRALVLGSHLDSVVNGGWLDGCYGVIAGLEVLRHLNERFDGKPPVTIRLVDWVDEEGARFGRSLLGSSACSGTLDYAEIAESRDADGILFRDALAENGVTLERMKESGRQLKSAATYLEIHVEQGPVLEGLGLPLGVVVGAMGAVRHRLVYHGQSGHPSGSPFPMRHDALYGGAAFIVGAQEIAMRHGGLSSVGLCRPVPGKMTILAHECEVVVEQNHIDAAPQKAIVGESLALARSIAAEQRLTVDIENMWEIDPIHFDPALIELAAESVAGLGLPVHRLPSGPLHDAAEVVRAGVPTTMLFVQSLKGLSHNKDEDTLEEHLELGVQALDALAGKALARLAGA